MQKASWMRDFGIEGTPGETAMFPKEFHGYFPAFRFLGVVSNGDVVGNVQTGTRAYSWKRKSFRRGMPFTVANRRGQLFLGEVCWFLNASRS